MRKVIVVLVSLLGIGLFTACQKDGSFADDQMNADDLAVLDIVNATNKQSVDPSELPSNIIDYTEENYFDTYIETAYSAAKQGFGLEMGSGDELFFTENGAALDGARRGCGGKGGRGRGGFGRGGGERVGIEDLPAGITDYVTMNYPDAEIKKAFLKEAQYYVLLSGRTVLTFDEGGTFVGEIMHESKDGEAIAIEDLPASITDYIAANYADAEIKRAKLVEDSYIVKLSGHILVKFDSEGNFLEEATFIHSRCGGGERIAIEDLPAAVTDYIAANYAEAEIKKAKINKEGNYVVGLMMVDSRLIVVFDADGNFLYERE